MSTDILYINTTHAYSFFFFFNDTATTEIYTLSLHDALPISVGLEEIRPRSEEFERDDPMDSGQDRALSPLGDRKSTRLNSSHLVISYAVFCLKKKHGLNVKSFPELEALLQRSYRPIDGDHAG